MSGPAAPVSGPIRRRSRTTLILACLSALFSLSHAALWQSSLRWDAGPDEWAHLDIAEYIARNGRLPVTGDPGLKYYPIWSATYAPCPPLAWRSGTGAGRPGA
jgi:hypothetical protein